MQNVFIIDQKRYANIEHWNIDIEFDGENDQNSNYLPLGYTY